MMRKTRPIAKAAALIMKECLCQRVQKAGRAIGRRFDEELRPLGVNNWQLVLLFSLSQQESPTIHGLADQLGMARTTLTKNLKPLERRGLVETRRDDADARIRRIVLTEAGYALLDDAVPRWQSANNAFASKLPAEELATVRAALEILAEAQGEKLGSKSG
jgi:DNA-binding MarR family transcriptional regulator